MQKERKKKKTSDFIFYNISYSTMTRTVTHHIKAKYSFVPNLDASLFPEDELLYKGRGGEEDKMVTT